MCGAAGLSMGGCMYFSGTLTLAVPPAAKLSGGSAAAVSSGEEADMRVGCTGGWCRGLTTYIIPRSEVQGV